jgi:hypothetical protein
MCPGRTTGNLAAPMPDDHDSEQGLLRRLPGTVRRLPLIVRREREDGRGDGAGGTGLHAEVVSDLADHP